MNEVPSGNTSSPQPDRSTRAPSSYWLFREHSRRLGAIATDAYQLTVQFLSKDVNTIAPPALRFPQVGLLQSKVDYIRDVVKRSNELLASATTVFLPIDLFPDTITIDRTKVCITKRSFFWTSQVITMRIEDVFNVTSNMGPFLGSITISTRIMNSTDHYEVNYLWRKDAIHLKQMLQGYMIALHNNLDTSQLSKEELVTTLLELGRDTSR